MGCWGHNRTFLCQAGASRFSPLRTDKLVAPGARAAAARSVALAMVLPGALDTPAEPLLAASPEAGRLRLVASVCGWNVVISVLSTCLYFRQIWALQDSPAFAVQWGALVQAVLSGLLLCLLDVTGLAPRMCEPAIALCEWTLHRMANGRRWSLVLVSAWV